MHFKLNFFQSFCISRNQPVEYKVFAKPHGPDVYKRFVNVYQEVDVTPTTVQQALTGDKAAGGPVLETTAEDYVFLFYGGMGGEGVVRCGGVFSSDDSSKEPDPTYVRLKTIFFLHFFTLFFKIR